MYISACIKILTIWGVVLSLQAQELEPRRWAHIPTGSNYVGGGYVRTVGDISLDPVLRAEDVELDMDTFLLKYIRSFEFLSKSARLSLTQTHHNTTWSGLLDGIPASIQRVGLADPILRFAVNLKGAPPLRGEEYLAYRAKQEIETIIGVGLSVQIPVGEYLNDKLINLGFNRLTIRSQLGVLHNHRNWSLEATGAVWYFTDNDDFYGGNELEQDPHYFLQGHLIHNFRPGVWLGLSVGYGQGGESMINGIDKDDQKQDLAWALGYGYAIAPRLSVKIAYVGTRTRESTGIDSDSLAIAFSTFW